ncbi:hypothetical protein F4806DRAFT_479590 [Annulohypoxylon nitens]|nr:hypothetical protein F4806DRAFT_479590 [Annulohypoxylon nitens]
MKTVLLPKGVFALSIAFAKHRITENLLQPTPDIIPLRLPQMTVWIWVHLLVADISNRKLSESTLGHNNTHSRHGPTTPMESLITLRTTVIFSMGMSFFFNSYLPSIAFMILLWLYNNRGSYTDGPWIRMGLNAIGISFFNQAAARFFLSGKAAENEKAFLNWYVLMAAVAMTTIYTQEFPDVARDEAQGRNTLPLLFGDVFPRRTVAGLVMIWSLISPRFWNASSWGVLVSSVGLGAIISGLVLLRLGWMCDQWAWRIWCLWIVSSYLGPLY